MTSPKGETLIVKNEERRVSFKSYCSSQAVNKTCITPWWLSDAVWSVSLLSAILLLWGGLASIWYHQAGCWSQRGGGAGCVPILLNRGRQRTGNKSYTQDIRKRYVFIKPYTKTRSHFCVVLKATQTHIEKHIDESLSKTNDQVIQDNSQLHVIFSPEKRKWPQSYPCQYNIINREDNEHTG